jgi:arsenate reductase
MTVRIYHNPRCSKSRQALQLLEGASISPEVVKYLETPPDAATLSDLLDMLGMEPRELMRKKEKEYKASGANDPDLTRDQLIALMVQHPKLIERPIVVSGGKAVLGRPPERVLEIL